jgi:orotidine-5'-phosphate decarboxylase
MNPRERLIFALDVDRAAAAEDLVRMLASEVGVFKVGLELFVAEGPAIVERVKRAGARAVFLDLKLHDIPATMRGAARSAAGLGVDLLTCHCDQPKIFSGTGPGQDQAPGCDRADQPGTQRILAGMGYPPELTDPRALVKKQGPTGHGWRAAPGWSAPDMKPGPCGNSWGLTP